ncbi:uncharacterized protein [Littorina saxatilis]|uniref:Uncharacterized protein n=1 Tax=Littorina saxatilis TaxID=31220 RepID=A0AAN9BQ56_9CAEN
MNRARRVFLYFSSWVFLGLCCLVLNVCNIDWVKTNIAQGIFVVLILGVIQGSVLEFPVQTISTLLIGGNRRQNSMTEATHLTLVLNYNVLALSKDDIDECLQTMYEAYMGNMCEKFSAVLVSATNDEQLKAYELQVRDNYRAVIYDTLFREGLNFASGDLSGVDPLRLDHVWRHYSHIHGDVFARDYLDGVCDEFAREFMVVHRVSRVLRKCGQYQDLMLLSEGDAVAYSYSDPAYYGRSARPYGQPLFHSSPDVDNIYNRRFDYTLVLDGDTGVVKGSVFQLLQVAAANPDRGIVQPAIKLHCTDTDTMFMHLESMRQEIYEPMTNAMTALFAQSSYFGKALINNRVYIDNVIGTRENLIERVPVDVLSHDTFEAALLRPLYCGSVFLLEAPSYNYVTWNIRERRWNRGEVLLSMYFWQNVIGRPMRWIQSKIQGEKFNPTKLRTESKLDFVTSYVAHSAMRQMMMKPMLLFYILIHFRTHLLYRWASIIVVMFLVLIFPKFATCNRRNYKYVLLETLASFVQFTPEALVGCVRIIRAVQANLVVNAKWVPQRAVEEEFKQSNPFWSSLVHLWGYSLFAVVAGVLVVLFAMDAILVMVMLGTLCLLPLYTGFTSLSKDLRSSRAIARRREALETGAIATIAQPDPKSQGGKKKQGSSGLIPAFSNFAFVGETGGSGSNNVGENTSVGNGETMRIPRPGLYPRLDVLDVQGLPQHNGDWAAGYLEPWRVLPSPVSSGVQELYQNIIVHPEAIDNQPRTVYHEDGRYVQPTGVVNPTYVNLTVPLAPSSSSLVPTAPPATPDLSASRAPTIPTAFSHRSFQSNSASLHPSGLLDSISATQS